MSRRAGAAALGLVLVVGAPATAQAELTAPPELANAAQRLFRASGAARTTQGGPVVRRLTPAVDAIVVTGDAALPEVGRHVPHLVRQVRPGIWEVHRDIHVVGNARLLVAWPQVKEVRLISMPRRFSSIVARNGHLQFRGPRRSGERRMVVHSWDPGTRRVDRDPADGRSIVAARRRSRLTISDARFEHLGFHEGTVSGVATRSVDGKEATGEVRRSRFSHNYFGAYTFQAHNMLWIDNEFTDNRIYGLDARDDSSGFEIRDNYVARNGRHGINCSRNCNNNLIVGNVAKDNRRHGIVVDDGKLADGPSSSNRVADNVVKGNTQVGISISGSHANVVEDNEVSGGRYGVRVIGNSQRNWLEDNRLARFTKSGIFLDGQPESRGIVSDTVLLDNRILGTETGIRLRNTSRTDARDNVVEDVRSYGFRVDGTQDRDADIQGNRIVGHGRSPVLVEDRVAAGVSLHDNQLDWDYPLTHDLARAMGWFAGPGLWALLLITVLTGPLLVRLGGARPGARTTS